MAVDVFLKMDIEGEATDNQHRGEIDVLNWKWGTSMEEPAAGPAKPDVSDMTIEKLVDKSSALLMLASFKGQVFGEALLASRRKGEAPLEYVKITLSDVVVSSYSILGQPSCELHDWKSAFSWALMKRGRKSGHGSRVQDELIEQITLSFQRIKYEYTPQKPDGSGDSTITTGWDIQANVEL